MAVSIQPTTTYRITVYHPDGDVYQSTPLDLHDPGRKALVEHMLLCVKGIEVLSFDDAKGGTTMFPHELLKQCVVRLVAEEEEE